MPTGIPKSSSQVEDRIKVDIQREATDSNPFLRVHWLRSLIAGIGRRIFDFYMDLDRTEKRLFPHTADAETAEIWGGIYLGSKNTATTSTGQVVATGNIGGYIDIGETLTSGGLEFVTTSAAAISLNTINVISITRSGTTATVTTANDHGLASLVVITINGAGEAEYNVAEEPIVVTGLNTFNFEVSGSPATPATGTITASFTSANVNVQSVGFGSATNLELDTPLFLQTPLVNVDNNLFVTYKTVSGGADEEISEDYKARYLDKIRNPVAHFNKSDITAKAKEVPGVTRVFIEPAGTQTGEISVLSITRSGNIATATTSSSHGYDDGMTVNIGGANQSDYNVTGKRIIISDQDKFHYIVSGSPATPATGTITASSKVALGQVRVFFMRNNDENPIPSAAEVELVKTKLDSILPANTDTIDLIVRAPTPVPVNFTFTSITPDTPTMRTNIYENLAQFFEENTKVGVEIDQDKYRAAIINTVDIDTGESLENFEISLPSSDILIGSGQIATLGDVIFP